MQLSPPAEPGLSQWKNAVFFLLDAQGSRICLATAMHHEDVNIEDDGVRLTGTRPLMSPAQGYSPVPKLPPLHLGGASDGGLRGVVERYVPRIAPARYVRPKRQTRLLQCWW